MATAGTLPDLFDAVEVQQTGEPGTYDVICNVPGHEEMTTVQVVE